MILKSCTICGDYVVLKGHEMAMSEKPWELWNGY